MAAIDWPSSPTVGQFYSYDTRRWRWNGVGWVFIKNFGQVVAVFTPGTEVETLIASPGGAISATFAWKLLTYI